MKNYRLGIILFLFLFPLSGTNAPAQGNLVFLPMITNNPFTPDLVFSAFGDSITSCYFDSKIGNFPFCGYPQRVLDKLASQSNRNVAFYNNGIGGERTSDGLARFEETLKNPGPYCVNPALPDQPGNCLYPPNSANPIPNLVIILEGVNDLGDGTRDDFIADHLSTMVQIAFQHGKKVILATIPPVTSKPGENRDLQAQRIAEFNPRIFQIGNNFQIPVVDLYSTFLFFPDWENSLIVEDGLHPNDLGFDVMAEAFYQTILSFGF